MKLSEDQIHFVYNFERMIVDKYQEIPDLLDVQIETAIDHLIRVYNAEAQERDTPKKTIRGMASEIAPQLQAICELHLGRAKIEDIEGKSVDIKITKLTAQEVVDSLKQINSSIKVWTKQKGRQGYLNYVTDFINK
ncbi:MAG TPA: hypothetical protein V6D19_25610 [Stenomitos sp.]